MKLAHFSQSYQRLSHQCTLLPADIFPQQKKLQSGLLGALADEDFDGDAAVWALLDPVYAVACQAHQLWKRILELACSNAMAQ